MEARWTVLRYFKGEHGRAMVEVVCSCGNTGTRRADHVRNGRTTSCKSCASKRTAKAYPPPAPIYKGVGDLSATFWFHINQMAKRRGIEVKITMEYAWNLFVIQDKKCALSGVPIAMFQHSRNCGVDWTVTTASLDRKDSNLGYVEGNVQWVHKTVNYIKRDLDEPEFIQWCKLVGDKCEI